MNRDSLIAVSWFTLPNHDSRCRIMIHVAESWSILIRFDFDWSRITIYPRIMIHEPIKNEIESKIKGRRIVIYSLPNHDSRADRKSLILESLVDSISNQKRIKVNRESKIVFFNISKKITQTCFQVRGQFNLLGRILLRLNKVWNFYILNFEIF